MDSQQADFTPLIASVVSIKPEEFERGLVHEQLLEPTAGLSLACQHCSFQCSDSASLEAHETDFHLCKVCGWRFKERENLLRHRRSHARAVLARAATKSCKFCGQEFVNNKILMRHIITSHESQQMDYLATSLHAQSEEKDSMDLDKIRPPENLSPPARKSTNAPKLLLPGFFHPTLKRGPIVEEAHERRAAVYKRKNGAIQNLGGVKEPGYIVIDKSADGGNLVKIVTSVGTKHNSSNDGSQREKDDENRRRHLDITESLDRMLEEFEEEEREERKREESERSKDDRALEDMATSNDGEATSESGGTTRPVTLLGDKEKTCDTMEPGKERSPSEGEFLNISFHDEILTEEQGNSRKRRRLAIVRDSKVVGRLTTSSLFKPPQNSHPYANHVSQAASVSDQYDQFWTEIGLVPKIKQRTVDRKVAKGKSEQKKTHPTMINRIGPSAKTSPTKSICMKKFPSEGFSSPDTSNLPTQTKNNTSLNCDICSEVFTDNQILAQHVKEEHPLKNEEFPRPPDTRKFKEGMWQVSNSLLRKKGLNKIKTEEEEVNSTKEGKTDYTLKDPMQPQKKVKEGLGNPGGKLKCNLCDFRTDFNWYLKKHTLSKHKEMNEYAFFCTKCPFKTNFKWNLKKHCNNKHSSCNSDTTTPKTDEDKTGKDLLNTNKRKGTDEAESSGTRSSQSKNGHSPKINSLQKNGTHEKKSVSKKKKDVRRTKIKVSVGGFTDKKMSEVPELNPYSRQLSCSRKEGKVEEERDFEEERRRNLVESLTEPYCRLCQLLLEPELRFGLMAKGEGVLPKLPKSSVVWVPKRKEGTEEDTNIEEEEEEEEEASVISKLLVCSSCQLCVHRSCYLLPEEENKEGWTCQACNLPPASLCSLCQQPGGLLQRTDRGRLVHLDCALLLPETKITEEGRLSLTKVPDKRRCLECVICGGQESHPGVHCQASSQCRVAFHPGCALRSRVDLVVGSRGRLILRCGFCVEKLGLRDHKVGKFDPQDIYVGEQVQLLSGQSATVLEVVPETYYSVAFDDGTFCDNHDPEEVKYDEGVELTINTEVRVMWEGDWCTGLFKGSNTLLWYRVRPDGGGGVKEVDRTHLNKMPSVQHPVETS